MIAATLMNVSIPFLKPTQSVAEANEILHHHKLSTLPVVEKGKYLGLISEDLLLDAANDEIIKHLSLEKIDVFATENLHYFDVLRIMNVYSLNIIAVVDGDSKYLGCINVADFAHYFSQLGFINAPGGILVLSINQNNYSLSEISRIAESDNIQILALFITDNTDNGFESYLTLKTNKTDLTRLIASYERFGYKIEAEFHESSFQNYEVERLEMLFKYLNM
jgi:acetoin utilization protein AcuB